MPNKLILNSKVCFKLFQPLARNSHSPETFRSRLSSTANRSTRKAFFSHRVRVDVELWSVTAIVRNRIFVSPAVTSIHFSQKSFYLSISPASMFTFCSFSPLNHYLRTIFGTIIAIKLHLHSYTINHRHQRSVVCVCKVFCNRGNYNVNPD
jgi:hypothetical protein